MDRKQVETLASNVVERLASAKENLRARMNEVGLTPARGWRIGEELHHTMQGTEWIFRPVHLRENAPDMYARVLIDHEGRLVEDDPGQARPAP